MFLKEVYRHSRWLFAGFLFFIVAQLVLNVKEGMVFSPLYHFNMYAWPQKPSPTYTIAVITYQGDTVRGYRYSPQQCDRLYYGLQNLQAARCDTFFYRTQISRLFKKVGLPVPDMTLYTNALTSAQRWERYKSNIGHYFGMDTAGIQVDYHHYRYAGGQFILVHPMNPTTPPSHLLCK